MVNKREPDFASHFREIMVMPGKACYASEAFEGLGNSTLTPEDVKKRQALRKLNRDIKRHMLREARLLKI